MLNECSKNNGLHFYRLSVNCVVDPVKTVSLSTEGLFYKWTSITHRNMLSFENGARVAVHATLAPPAGQEWLFKVIHKSLTTQKSDAFLWKILYSRHNHFSSL